MDTEEGKDTPVPTEVTWWSIWHLIHNRRPFPADNDGSNTRDRRIYISRTGFPWIGRPLTRVSPIAFAANVTVHIKDGERDESGDMVPYLFVYEGWSWFGFKQSVETRLVQKVEHPKGVSYMHVTDLADITSEDIARIEIGRQGSPALLEAEFMKVVSRIYADYDN